LTELQTPAELRSFISNGKIYRLICFSAHWCGPCKSSKPQLLSMVESYERDDSIEIEFGIVYENVLGDILHNVYCVKAFPTYILYHGEEILDRVEGVNFDSIRKLINELPRKTTMEDVPGKLAPDSIEQLTSVMGFPLLHAQKGLMYGGGSVEGAVEWLSIHQDDPDIDEPLTCEKTTTTTTTSPVMKSYKCNECGKIISNMANLELHANKTGHSDFEESTESVVPLTQEQKEAKVTEIKNLLKAKRLQREEEEKKERVDREKQRRFMGKEQSKLREEMDKDERKRAAEKRKKEKDNYRLERERIRAELERDKAERRANKGRLHSKLDVDGYRPDAIQYDTPSTTSTPAPVKSSFNANPANIDEYITKISSYRAGGDGGKCLKILHVYIRNIIDHPKEPKYRHIKSDNKVYKQKIKPFIGAKALLSSVGFKKSDNIEEDALVMEENQINLQFLSEVKEKLKVAMENY